MRNKSSVLVFSILLFWLTFPAGALPVTLNVDALSSSYIFQPLSFRMQIEKVEITNRSTFLSQDFFVQLGFRERVSVINADMLVRQVGPDDWLRMEVYGSVSDPERYLRRVSNGKLAGISSSDTLSRALNLSKVVDHRRKRAFMFVFLMDNVKTDKELPVVVKKDDGAAMHVLASKKIVSETLSINDLYFIDVSVARYSDGYAPGEWNLVLPSGKPREVTVSLLWSF